MSDGRITLVGILMLCTIPAATAAQTCPGVPTPSLEDVRPADDTEGGMNFLMAATRETRELGLHSPPGGSARDTLEVVVVVYLDEMGAPRCAGVTTPSGHTPFDSAILRAACSTSYTPGARGGSAASAWREISNSRFVTRDTSRLADPSSGRVEWMSCMPVHPSTLPDLA